ncbi:branched-chain-amino-acid transaminase [Ignavibacteria bacterium]|nr:branched-chain amino acid transaminase [Bacteroidota bacterium]MCZ2132061.1 branched-chain amino acid transaminase [Bacteroidota bacterium]
MALTPTPYIWMNGNYVSWEDAKIHVLSHVVHYGSSWFEGMRAYKTSKGTAIFRLREHIHRLSLSVKIYRGELPFSEEDICDACCELIRRNKVEACYLRPVAYRGYGELGVYPLTCPLDVAIALWSWGKYLGKEAHEQGVDVCVSSWQRLTNNSMPAAAKAGGNYLSSQLIRIEANQHGYAEGIGLDINGNVSEGSGENIFFVSDGVIYTPPMSASILQGITRASAITIAEELGCKVVEQVIPRSMLYTSDEIFFTGTAVEITPVRSVDRIPVGNGSVGEITKNIQKKFFEVVEQGEDARGWLTFI